MKLRILIVEDEKLMVEILERIIAPFASQIDSTPELEPAMQMAVYGKYNVVILDLRLGSTGKTQALNAIHEFKRLNSAVLVVSGLPDSHLREEVMAAGADGFVPKDNNMNERALLLAINIATLRLPRDSFKSDSYLNHVELLRKLSETEI